MSFVCIVLCMYLLKESSCIEGEMLHPSWNVKRFPDMGSLCPYNQYCKSQPTNIITEGIESCCEKCSCEPNCHETGSCCYDAPTASSTASKYPCVPLSEFSKDERGLLSDQDEDLHFHVITDCSDENKDNEYHKCYLPTDIEDFVIVSDPRSGRVFRNKHCAKCNDIHEYELWKVNLQCLEWKSIFDMKSFEELEDYVKRDCSLLSYPPHENAGRLSFCNQAIISKCNITGKWDIYDGELFKACNQNRESQNAVFRLAGYSPIFDVYYSSVYCFFCNKPQSLVKKDECNLEDPYTSRTSDFIRILADIETQNDKVSLEDQRLGCKSFEIWDPFKNICRQLLCPRWKKPLNGRCIGLFSNINGLTFSLNFEIKFVVGQMPNANKNLLLLLEKIVFSTLGEKEKCGKCRTILYSHMAFPDTIFAEINVFTTENCTYDVISRRMRKLAETENMYFQLSYKGNVAGIELKLTYENFYTDELYEVTLLKNYNNCPMSKVMDNAILLQCARILISKEEADDIGFNISKLTGNITDLEEQPVCLDTYFSRHNSKSGACSVYVNSMKQSLQTNLRLFAILVSIILKETILIDQ